MARGVAHVVECFPSTKRKGNVAYIDNGILFSYKKALNLVICSHIG
jgi:hypothetical protein